MEGVGQAPYLELKGVWARPISLHQLVDGFLIKSHKKDAGIAAEPIVFTLLVHVTPQALADAAWARQFVVGDDAGNGLNISDIGAPVMTPVGTTSRYAFLGNIRSEHIDWTPVDLLEAHINAVRAVSEVAAVTRDERAGMRLAFLRLQPFVMLNFVLGREHMSLANYEAIAGNLGEMPWHTCALADIAASGLLGKLGLPMFVPQFSALDPLAFSQAVGGGLADLSTYAFAPVPGTLAIATATRVLLLHPDDAGTVEWRNVRGLRQVVMAPSNANDRPLANELIGAWYYDAKGFSVRDPAHADFYTPVNLIAHADYLAFRLYAEMTSPARAAKRAVLANGDVAAYDPVVALATAPGKHVTLRMSEYMKRATTARWRDAQMQMLLQAPTATRDDIDAMMEPMQQ